MYVNLIDEIWGRYCHSQWFVQRAECVYRTSLFSFSINVLCTYTCTPLISIYMYINDYIYKWVFAAYMFLCYNFSFVFVVWVNNTRIQKHTRRRRRLLILQLHCGCCCLQCTCTWWARRAFDCVCVCVKISFSFSHLNASVLYCSSYQNKCRDALFHLMKNWFRCACCYYAKAHVHQFGGLHTRNTRERKNTLTTLAVYAKGSRRTQFFLI